MAYSAILRSITFLFSSMALSRCPVPDSNSKIFAVGFPMSKWKCNQSHTVKPEIFACPLFREFRNLGKFAKITGREYGRRDDLLCFYSTVIRPVLEYACPVWHSSLTAAQTKALESYHLSLLIRAGLDTLESRREQLTERFFKRSVLPETSCLHCSRTSVTSPSHADCAKEEHWNL